MVCVLDMHVTHYSIAVQILLKSEDFFFFDGQY